MEDAFSYTAADINGHSPTTGGGKWNAFYSPESVISVDGTKALINTAGGKPGSGGAIALYPFTPKKNMLYALVVTLDYLKLPGVSSMGGFGFAAGDHGEKANPWMIVRAQNSEGGDSGIIGFCDDPEREAGGWVAYAAFYPTITGVITLNTKTNQVDYYINNILQGGVIVSPPKINYLFFKNQNTGDALAIKNIKLLSQPAP